MIIRLRETGHTRHSPAQIDIGLHHAQILGHHLMPPSRRYVEQIAKGQRYLELARAFRLRVGGEAIGVGHVMHVAENVAIVR